MSLPLPEMEPCYFCEIVAGRSEPWNVIARDELTITLLNGRQFEAGQCMVVPLRHAPTLLEVSDGEAAAVMQAARRLAQVMLDVFGPDGVLLYQNNGTGSGQEVPHFHLHVVPRRAGSDWGLGPPHLAHLETAPAPQFHHAAVTPQKRAVVAQLRDGYV